MKKFPYKFGKKLSKHYQKNENENIPQIFQLASSVVICQNLPCDNETDLSNNVVCPV